MRRVLRSQMAEEHLGQNRGPSVRGVSRNHFVQCSLPLDFFLLGHQQALVNSCRHALQTFRVNRVKSVMIAASYDPRWSWDRQRMLGPDLTYSEVPRVYLSCRARHWMSANHSGDEDKEEKATYSASRMVVEIPINSERMSGALLVFS